ncbi:SENSORY BOX/GGDEF FAMILY PROTEIN [hydrothermal vent metagenome]|uniref:SENSORY BOX/GGDEF FAMILY PROTEIN n=1 Tax=hydrothermal vent metagenome TaxID=652676 RepID=A0A3B0WN00_9ZZZZ
MEKIFEEGKYADIKDMDGWIFQEKVKLLYKNQLQSWVFSILASMSIAYLSLNTEVTIIGMSWWLVFVSITLVRLWNTLQFNHAINEGKTIDYKYWFNRFYAGTLTIAFAWGICGFIMKEALTLLEQGYIFIVITAMGAAAIPFLGVAPRVVFSFQAISILPFGTYMILQLDQFGFIHMYIFALFVTGLIAAVRRMDVNLTDSMMLQYENLQMISTMSNVNHKLQMANEKLESLTLEDTLTELHNRRYFEKQLEAKWKHDVWENKELTLMIIDIDYFKLYNDTYGHAEGDVCLKRVAKVLKSSLRRPTDIIARIGGEEFVVMLPGAGVNVALKIAQQMQDELSLTDLVHESSPLDKNVTVSVGIASVILDRNTTSLGLFKAADKALYQAKANGRNQTAVGGDRLSGLEPMELDGI